jgi:tRNA/tmRNA/rRNA uracil-C5-methylase (TrmA/RlmC/RlmD family)
MITMCMIILPAALVPEERYALQALGASAGFTPPKPEAPADGTMVGVSSEPAGLVATGQLLDLAVGEAVHGGWCVARPPPGGAGANDQDPEPAQPVVFVRHALPGERVRAVVTQANARFARADAIEIITSVPERVPVPCPYATPGGCGGCDWQHASLAAQRTIKSAVVSQQLKRIAGIERVVTVEPVPGDTDGLGWRSRVRFAVDAGGRAGLFRHRSHEIVPVSDCLIAHPLVRQAAVTRTAWPGARWVEVVAAPGTGERAVLVDAGAASRPSAWLAPGGQGPRCLTQRAAGRDWRVSATGFWQIHPGAADLLAEAVLAAVRPEPGETALDLFCGVGLFASVLAERVGSEGAVIGIERDAAAVRDARYNLRSVPWARVYRGDAADVLRRIGLSGASVAVLDPPRAGADRQLIETLCGEANQPGTRLRSIAYASCDPATLARDIAYFGRLGWRLDGLRAFDAFPMTHHVECLATIVPPAG